MNIFYGKHHTSPIIHWAGVVEKDLQKKQDLNIERQLQVVKCGKYIPVGRNKTQRLRTRNTSDTLKRTRGQRIVSPNHIDGLNQLFTVPGSLLLQPMYHYSRRHRKALTTQKSPVPRMQEATGPSMRDSTKLNYWIFARNNAHISSQVLIS